MSWYKKRRANSLAAHRLAADPLLATLRIDNKSALQQAMDPVSLDASKHIDLRAHFLRERARDRVVLPEYVDTTTNWADGMTKSQPVSTFLRFASEVCVTAAPSTPRSD